MNQARLVMVALAVLVFAFNELHHEGVAFDAPDLRDVRVIERCITEFGKALTPEAFANWRAVSTGDGPGLAR